MTPTQCPKSLLTPRLERSKREGQRRSRRPSHRGALLPTSLHPAPSLNVKGLEPLSKSALARVQVDRVELP